MSIKLWPWTWPGILKIGSWRPVSSDGTIRLWDSRTAKPSQPFVTEESLPAKLALSPGGDKLLTGSHSPPFHVHVYSVPDGRKLLTFAEHASAISSIAIAPDGRTAVTIGTDANEILLWDIATGQVRQRLETAGRAIYALGVSHDGRDVGFGFQNPCPEQVMCPEKFGSLTQTFALRNAQGDWHLASTSLSQDQAIFDRARLVHGPYRVQGPQFDVEDVKKIDLERIRQEGKNLRSQTLQRRSGNRFCNELDWIPCLYVYCRRPVCRSRRPPGGHQLVPSARHATGCVAFRPQWLHCRFGSLV